MTVRPATLAALLFAVLALLVAGCGSDETTAGSSAATPAATATATATEAQSEPATDGDSEEERQREEQEAKKAGGTDCAGAGDLDADAKRQPPSDMEVLSYAHLYKSEGPFGKTERFYAVLDGTKEELASRRDDAQNELVQNFGFASLSTDQEEGAEAEAHLKGDKHTVDIQVTPLCEGKLRIRYTVQ
jgi:hypothetical protein